MMPVQASSRSSTRGVIARAGVVAAACLLAAWSTILFKWPEGIAVIFPADGVLLAGLLLTPARHWWSVLCGAGAIILGANLLNGQALPLAWGSCLANVLDALVAASLPRLLHPKSFDLSGPREVLLLTGSAVVSGAAAAAVGAGTLAVWNGDPWHTAWLAWWLSSVLGTLLVAPVLLTWSTARLGAWRQITMSRLAEGACLFVGLAAAASWGFLPRLSVAEPALHRPALTLPFLLWAACRFGTRGTATALGVLSLIAIWGTATGRGTWAALGMDLPSLAFASQIQLLMLCALLVPAAIVQRRRAAEKRFHALLESTPDAMVIVDAQGRIVLVNAQTTKLFGYPADELHGRPVEVLMPARYRERHVRHRAQYTARPEVRPMGAQLKLFGLHRDGHEIPVEVCLSPIEDANGLLIAAAIHDATARRREADELRRAYVELEQRVAERTAALATSEERLSLAIKAAGMGTWDVDLTTGRMSLSDTVFAMLGHEPQEAGTFTCELWQRRIHPEDLAAVLQATEVARNERSLFDKVYRVVRASDGQIVWIRAFGRFMYGDDGAPVRFVGVVFDDTARQQAMAHIKATEERYRLLADAMEDFVSLSDAQRQSIYVSPSFYRATGFTPEEVAATDFSTRVHPDDLPRLEEARRRNLRGERTTVEWRCRRRDESYFWVETHANPVRDAAGQVRHIVCSSRNIHDRKLGQAVLAESERRYRALVQALPDTLLRFTPEGRLLEYKTGQNFPTVEGVAPDRLEQLLPAQVAARCLAAAARARQHGAVETMEYEIATESGSRQFETRVVSLGEHELAAVIRDVTLIRQTEAELRQQQAALAHVQRVYTMGEMASGLAHEINQPLAAIMNSTQAALNRLASEPLDLPKIRASLTRAVQQCANAAEVIQRLRSFVASREPHLSSVDLNELVPSAIALLEYECKQAAVELDCQLAPDLPLIPLDRVRILQVIVNLLRNAIEAVQEVPRGRRRVCIATSAADKYLELIVQDSGDGVPREFLPRLFDAFATTKPDGLGMGLAISRTIVEVHGGQLQYEDGQPGAIFHVRLPLSHQTGPAALHLVHEPNRVPEPAS